MADQGGRNGREALERLEKERESLEREREALARERERIAREREKFERAQEVMEGRLERQEERLERLEEELEDREESLEEEEEELEDLGIEGIEEIREVLDAVSDHIPRLVRGIQESVYSADQLKSTAEAYGTFYKTLIDAGMPNGTAAALTREHFEHLQSQVELQMGGHKGTRRPVAGPGPDFDPLGPDFDPLSSLRRTESARPAKPAGAEEPTEP